MATARKRKKKVSPLDIVQPQSKNNRKVRDRWPDEFREFWADACRLYWAGELPGVSNSYEFARFIVAAIKQEFPSVPVCYPQTYVRYLNDDADQA